MVRTKSRRDSSCNPSNLRVFVCHRQVPWKLGWVFTLEDVDTGQTTGVIPPGNNKGVGGKTSRVASTVREWLEYGPRHIPEEFHR
ncbi:MAG: hypothetical protein Ct9H300mP1_32790 [Planctomycetaceae bacterium]|nr:MAG: hypothetical protein Ct9H300mP1_32790 [Planctomycetaceae bacterium]